MIGTIKCLICGEEYDNHSQHIKYRHHLTGKEYYDKCLKTEEDGKCLECGGETKFRTIGAGYQKYCSRECMLKHRPQNIKNAVLEKYGVDNVRKVASINKQIEETNLKKYGCISPFGNKGVQEKTKHTNLERYGVESVLSSKEIREKIENTCIERYGTPYIGNVDFIQEKIKNVVQEKYGVKSTFQLNEVKEKSKETCLKKYGKEYAAQSDVVKEKCKQTCLERYGVEYSFQSDNNKEKTKKTLLEKYGVENILDSLEIQEKIKNTMIKNHGVDSPFKSGEIQLKVQKSNKIESENIIYGELIKMFPEVKRQYKSKEYPFFCDFYIPSLDLYIEYNGFFTHNAHPFDKNNINDIKEAEELYQKGLDKGLYMSAYKVWTQSDPHKVEIARKNKIKLLVFYNMKDVENWIKKRKELKDG